MIIFRKILKILQKRFNKKDLKFTFALERGDIKCKDFCYEIRRINSI